VIWASTTRRTNQIREQCRSTVRPTVPSRGGPSPPREGGLPYGAELHWTKLSPLMAMARFCVTPSADTPSALPGLFVATWFSALPKVVGLGARPSIPKSFVVATVPCLRMPMLGEPLLPALVLPLMSRQTASSAELLFPASTRMPGRTPVNGAATVLFLMPQMVPHCVVHERGYGGKRVLDAPESRASFPSPSRDLRRPSMKRSPKTDYYGIVHVPAVNVPRTRSRRPPSRRMCRSRCRDSGRRCRQR
jgi:hypothetical protein